MKRLLLIFCVAFISVNAMAQYSATEPDFDNKPVDIRGSRVYVDKKKLDKRTAANCFSSLNGIDRSKDYLKYRAGYKTGLGLTFGGLGLAAVGFMATSVSTVVGVAKALTCQDMTGANAAIYLGVGSFFLGSACFVAGIPVACVYKTRLNRLEKEHNASLQVNAIPGGMSLAISF